MSSKTSLYCHSCTIHPHVWSHDPLWSSSSKWPLADLTSIPVMSVISLVNILSHRLCAAELTLCSLLFVCSIWGDLNASWPSPFYEGGGVGGGVLVCQFCTLPKCVRSLPVSLYSLFRPCQFCTLPKCVRSLCLSIAYSASCRPQTRFAFSSRAREVIVEGKVACPSCWTRPCNQRRLFCPCSVHCPTLLIVRSAVIVYSTVNCPFRCDCPFHC